ncbi:helix-turn-helix transcriptional regulator [Aneurinibacillus sp. Ricciae_BoGa-3]|uniref:helix-turn-helix transcriptional regulator n=1 Tax=Aneurinibacillus sp. Ricciae_BoGa-3 TaxID=3022697 RepID=UPI0023401278|nr:helix-turn-helix transcriptional regulator [Aneurinibacillus sp. Ricciae_BoGa-3]WCK56551.1 helix-turn-helix transcriptional regulator [Aneurinibacillus sp. Ricciae_BoGa-3]
MNGKNTPQFTKQTFDRMISEKLRLIRTEARLNQEQLADAIGISKKTLVQVEKDRKTLGFTAAALVGLLFRNSEIVQALFGESIVEILDLIAFHGIDATPTEDSLEWIQEAKMKARYKSSGHRVWWKDEKAGAAYTLQSHILTGHLRIVDNANALHYYGMDRAEAEKHLLALEQAAK